ncbi:hypothetical protein As57867_001161, partial [Aphanomyces stellatus]
RSLAALSWKDIALGLQDDANLSKSQSKALRRQVRDQAGLLRDMQRWVEFTIMTQAPNARTSTWRDVTLLANPASRQLGKEWITKQMYHNTDRMFHQHGFGHPDHVYFTHEILFTDAGLEFVLCRQFTSVRSIDELVRLNRDNLCNVLLVNLLQVPETPTVDASGHVTQHQMVSIHGDYVNLVCGEFWNDTRDRCVLAIQQIHHDELWDATQFRNRTIWLDIRQRGNGAEGCTARLLSLASQSHLAGGRSLSVDAEARNWGLDLTACPPAQKEALFRRFATDFLDTLLRRL